MIEVGCSCYDRGVIVLCVRYRDVFTLVVRGTYSLQITFTAIVPRR